MTRAADVKTVVLLQPRLGYMDSMRSAPSLPLGLLHAASVAVDSFKIILFDQRLSHDWKRDLAGIIARENPLAIGTTMCIGPPAANALNMLDYAATLCRAPRFAGGVLPSMVPESCAAHTGGAIDFVIQGEGEFTLPVCLDRLARGELPNDIKGVWVREGQAMQSPGPAELLDLEPLVEIPYQLVDIHRYLPEYERCRTFYMESSRGCPMKCGYCYNPVFNRGVWRAQSHEKVRQRLEYVKREFGVDHIYFVDDNFFTSKERGMRIAGHLMDLGMDWQVQGVDIHSLKNMTAEDLAYLKASGLVRISIGIESGSERVRQFLGKKFLNEDVYEISARLKAAGLVAFCSFMSNIPTETDSELGESARMALRLTKTNEGLRVSPFYRYVPSPGTGVFDAAVQQGYAPPQDLRAWGGVSFDWNETGETAGARDALLERLYTATLFCDFKSRDYTTSPVLRALAAIYRPLARFRMKHMFFGLMPEARFFTRFVRRVSGER